MKIYNALSRRPHEATISGNGFSVPKFTYTVLKGVKTLVHSSDHNLYDEIQSYKDDTSLENILARASVDPSVLDTSKLAFLDTTKFPKNLADAQKIIIESKDYFYSLPIEVRNKFNNNPELFINSVNDKDFMEKIKPNVPIVENVVENLVKKEVIENVAE